MGNARFQAEIKQEQAQELLLHCLNKAELSFNRRNLLKEYFYKALIGIKLPN